MAKHLSLQNLQFQLVKPQHVLTISLCHCFLCSPMNLKVFSKCLQCTTSNLLSSVFVSSSWSLFCHFSLWALGLTMQQTWSGRYCVSNIIRCVMWTEFVLIFSTFVSATYGENMRIWWLYSILSYLLRTFPVIDLSANFLMSCAFKKFGCIHVSFSDLPSS